MVKEGTDPFMGGSNWKGVRKMTSLNTHIWNILCNKQRTCDSRTQLQLQRYLSDLWNAVCCAMWAALSCLEEEVEQGSICLENRTLHRNPWVSGLVSLEELCVKLRGAQTGYHLGGMQWVGGQRQLPRIKGTVFLRVAKNIVFLNKSHSGRRGKL